MDEFNNNGQQGYDPNLYGQPSQGYNNQPPQFGGAQNAYGGQPQYNQYDPNMGMGGQPTESKGMSIASLACGVLSLVACFINGWLMIILAICGIVFGIIGRKKGGKGMATAGIICGSASLIIYILLIIFVVVVGVASFGSLY